MPGINGFQTKRALEQSGSRAPVVFLSAEDTDACVSEAFQCGARGFVAKTHLVRDLAYALDQVVHRRLFAPSLRSLHQATAAGGHAIHVHSDEKSFAASIASCFDAALLRGDANVLHRVRICGGVVPRARARAAVVDHRGAFGGMPRTRLVT